MVSTSRVYKYDPRAHKLVLEPKDDSMDAFYEAVGQKAVNEAPACLVITINPSRTAGKLGDNATKCAYMEAGHAAQNVCLQTAAMGLSTVTIGGFDAGKVKKALALPKTEQPVYVMPVGKAGK